MTAHNQEQLLAIPSVLPVTPPDDGTETLLEEGNTPLRTQLRLLHETLCAERNASMLRTYLFHPVRALSVLLGSGVVAGLGAALTVLFVDEFLNFHRGMVTGLSAIVVGLMCLLGSAVPLWLGFRLRSVRIPLCTVVALLLGTLMGVAVFALLERPLPDSVALLLGLPVGFLTTVVFLAIALVGCEFAMRNPPVSSEVCVRTIVAHYPEKVHLWGGENTLRSPDFVATILRTEGVRKVREPLLHARR